MSRKPSAVPNKRISMLLPIDLYRWLTLRQEVEGHRSLASYVNVILRRHQRDQQPAAVASTSQPEESTTDA